jgi:hypothetical protein
MKKINLLIGASIITMNIFAQQNPTNNNPLAPGQNGRNAIDFWSRAGNSGIGANNSNNIFGTLWNSPIYTQTGGVTRMRLNGTLTTPIWSVNQNVSGYIGIDPTGFFNNNVPQTMLHLHSSNVPVFTTGWRRWMKTGMLIEENSDGMYVGMKTELSSNRSDAIINWFDDGTNAGGIDKLRFIFTGSTPTGNGNNTNSIDYNSLNGYEYMRMQSYPLTSNSTGNPIGHVGIGPVFTNALPPQNRLHINSEENIGAFVQISNASGTGQTNLDGFKFGYATTSATNLTANINQMENDKLLVFTNNAERIRISHIGNISTPNMNPGGLANNLTRVSISHDPANPVTKPLSLLHLGYNTGSLLNPNNTDGWRPWMDVGMFVAQSSDNVYLGLKNESTTLLGDKYDAVLSWGDNQINSGLPPNNGPDNFRFIFTSSTTNSAGGTTPATGADGLEGMRLTPTTANGVYTGIGGAPTVNPYTAGLNAGNTAEINSWGATNVPGGSSGLRFTNLNTTSPMLTNPGLGVLAVNAQGDVIYVPDQGGNFGVDCGSSNAGLLPNDWRIGMNGHSVNFVGTGNVNIGDLQNCIPGSTSLARLWVRNSFGAPNPTTGIRVDNVGGAGTYAGYFSNGDLFCTGAVFGNSSSTFSDKNIKTNVNTITNSMAVISKLRAVSYKYDNTYAPQLTFDGNTNYGFIAQEVAAIVPELVKTTTVYSGYDSLGNAVGSDVSLKALNYDAIIPFAVGAIQELNAKQREMQAVLDKSGLSDAQVKTNVNSFNALATLKTLSPVKYNFTNANVPQLNFKPNTDYGFIAQQLETVYPELVDTIRVDATFDSVGVVINPSKVLKTVNYKAMSALLVRSVQEQQQTIDSLRNTQNAILQQLAALASQINACCSNTTASRQSNSNINQLDIELSDKDAIVLNQNVPNPFAEQTTITYNVPASVGKAQLIFFNTNGQVIQTVDIKTRGKGKVNVFASDLSSGLYNYTLVADGKVIDSKKMVRE